MDNFNDIKGLWQNQPTANLPDVGAIKKAADKNRRQIIIRNVWSLLALGGTVIFTFYIGMAYDFKFITTRLGIMIIIIGIVGAMAINSQMLKLLLSRADESSDNQAYLRQLIEYRNKQRFLQSRGMVIYYLLLTTGFMLYLYEFFARDHMFGLKAYAVTLSWIAFTWFYLKPRAIRKQEKKISDLIEQIESISKQLQ